MGVSEQWYGSTKMVQFHKLQGSAYKIWESQNNVSQNAGIASHKKLESQKNGTVSQNSGIAA
jgi:hypothetical protein